MTAAFRRIEEMIAEGRPVLLDGAVGSELERVGYEAGRNTAELWGTRALDEAPELTFEVHRRYAAAGADVITTNTWRLDRYAVGAVDPVRAADWRELAVWGVELAREAGAGPAPPAVAFSLFTEPIDPDAAAALAEAAAAAEPDLILVETTESIPENLHFPEFEALLETGLPLWVSYRWTREGPCDVSDLGIRPIHGRLQEASGELLGRAAARLEELGVRALLLNCLPAYRVGETLPYLREYTALPLGVYPNAGVFLDPGWDDTDADSPESFAAMLAQWHRNDGAAILGGCCGVGVEHIAAARVSFSSAAVDQ